MPTSKKEILSETTISTFNPLRLIGLLFPILGIFVHSADITAQATFGIFGWIILLIAMSVGFTAILERNARISGHAGAWLLYISTMSLGTISLEFAGILAHTSTLLMTDSATISYWNNVSIALLIGGFGLSAFQSYIKRFNRAMTDDRVKIILIVGIIPALIYMENLVWSHLVFILKI